MDFDGGAAVAAGLIGGAVMALLLYMGIAMMASQMKMNLFRLLGTMLLEEGTAAYVLGGMIHAMISVVFGLIHVGLYTAFDLESDLAAWGLLFGVGHWMIVGMGLGMMGMMPMMHRGIRSGSIDAPGFYALNYPRITAMGFLVLHLVYGVLVGVFYTAFT